MWLHFLHETGTLLNRITEGLHCIYSRDYHLDQAIIWGELNVCIWFTPILKHTICSFGTRNMWFAEETVCCTEALVPKQWWESQKHLDQEHFGSFLPWYSGIQQVHTEYWILTRRDGSKVQKLHSTTFLSFEGLPRLWRYCEEKDIIPLTLDCLLSTSLQSISGSVMIFGICTLSLVQSVQGWREAFKCSSWGKEKLRVNFI